MPQSIRLAVIAGDGIGPEVIAEALKVLGPRSTASPPSRRPTTTWAPGAGTPPARRCPTPSSTRSGSTTPSCSAPSATRACPAASSSAGCCCGCGSSSTTTSTCVRPSSTRASELAAGATPATSTSSWSARAPRAPTSATAASLRAGTPHEVATEVSVNTALRRRARRARRVRPRRRAGRAGTSRWCTRTTCSSTPAHLWRRTVERVGRGVPRRDRRPTCTSTRPRSSWSPTRRGST